jgi:hypothetical protein
MDKVSKIKAKLTKIKEATNEYKDSLNTLMNKIEEQRQTNNDEIQIYQLEKLYENYFSKYSDLKEKIKNMNGKVNKIEMKAILDQQVYNNDFDSSVELSEDE